MSLRLSVGQGDSTVLQIADALGFGDEISDVELQFCRMAAFDSTSADEFREWYLRYNAFNKFVDASGADLVTPAIQKFMDAETACREANSRLVDIWNRARINPRAWRKARSIIGAVLGRFPLDELPWRSGFGPGASGSLQRSRSSHQNKWVLSSHITEEALPYYVAFHRSVDLPIPDNLEVVGGNRVTTVPKSWKTDRVIAIEPDWNMFFQKGLGSLIRTRLQRRGILLPTAQEQHWAMAQKGSADGSLATLDLSNASDSVSLALCEALLPEDWFNHIMRLRSPRGTLPDGTPITYEKVSSMGNGFTFELETLFFYALTCAVSRNGVRDISVYGDDIICPSGDADATMAILVEAGFTVNTEKSFWEGPFRESCGGHFFEGTDVTPWFVRGFPSNVADAIVIANAMAMHAATAGWADLREFSQAYNSLRRLVPKKYWGPWGLDGALHAPWDKCCPKWNRDTQSYSQHLLTYEHKYLDLSSYTGAYLHKLWTTEVELEASRLPRSSRRLKSTRVFLDRNQWLVPPVRLT